MYVGSGRKVLIGTVARSLRRCFSSARSVAIKVLPLRGKSVTFFPPSIKTFAQLADVRLLT